MAKKYKDQSRLQYVCSGGEAGQIFLVGILHVLPDPIADMESAVLDFRLGQDRWDVEPIVQAADYFVEYHSWFHCIVRDPAGTLYVGQESGYIRYANGKGTAVHLGMSIGMTGTVQCAYVRGVDDIVLGTCDGEIVPLQGDKATLHKVGTSRFEHITACLSRIHGIGPDFIVVVGDGGNIGCYRNGKWEKIRPPRNVKLEAVWCRSPTEIYIGGWNELAWRWNGADKWEPLTGQFKPSEEPGTNSQGFHDFAEYQGELYAATSEYGIQKLQGDAFVPVPKVKEEYVGRLFATNIGLVGLGGVWGDEGSWFTLYDGERWRSTQVKLKRAK